MTIRITSERMQEIIVAVDLGRDLNLKTPYEHSFAKKITAEIKRAKEQGLITYFTPEMPDISDYEPPKRPKVIK